MDHFSLEKPFGDRSTIMETHFVFFVLFLPVEGTIMLKHNRVIVIVHK